MGSYGGKLLILFNAVGFSNIQAPPAAPPEPNVYGPSSVQFRNVPYRVPGLIESWPMFSLYRRHERTCRFKQKGIRHTTCTCPVWMDGYDERGRRQRRSMKTRSWSQAQYRLSEIEGGRKALPDPSPSISAAVKAFLDDGRARNLEASTLTRYTNTLRHLTAFLGSSLVASVDLVKLTEYRAGRNVAASTSGKELETIRAFFRFCAHRKWCAENPARDLKAPKADVMPTMPFTSEEITAILDACERIDNQNPREIPRARLRARALVLLLLYSGFRISDAVKLARSNVNLQTGQLMVRMMKTKQPLYLTLHPDAVKALSALPKESPYFFWSGTSKLSTSVGSCRRTIDCLMKLANIEDGHPHRFRDTFSVGLLEKGAELRTVQLLLGHTSIRTTEKHYAPFVRSMQRILDEAVSTLHFSGFDPKLIVNANQNALRDAKRDPLPFPRAKRR